MPGWRFFLGVLLLAGPGLCCAQAPSAAGERPAAPPPPGEQDGRGPQDELPPPRRVDKPPVVPPPAEKPAKGDVLLPINLATALRLADARPILIAAAAASVQQAAAQLDQAKVLWLPNLYLGASFYRHDGGGA